MNYDTIKDLIGIMKKSYEKKHIVFREFESYVKVTYDKFETVIFFSKSLTIDEELISEINEYFDSNCFIKENKIIIKKRKTKEIV